MKKYVALFAFLFVLFLAVPATTRAAKPTTYSYSWDYISGCTHYTGSVTHTQQGEYKERGTTRILYHSVGHEEITGICPGYPTVSNSWDNTFSVVTKGGNASQIYHTDTYTNYQGVIYEVRSTWVKGQLKSEQVWIDGVKQKK